VIRTYLEWLVELPWDKETEDDLDIAHAREVLDADHYDLETVKDRILEYLAVRTLQQSAPPPPLRVRGCRGRQRADPLLCRPAGVGKTSLGRRSRGARARVRADLGRRRPRRGGDPRSPPHLHRGAARDDHPALRDAGTRNPVFMIDEIDKMGADFRGDPSSAMLEVLDPAQNRLVPRHYLDLEFDLSDVLFIATRTRWTRFRRPLQDRMEVIQLAGYTADEKLHIAKRYLVPRQIEQNGLARSQISFADPALRAIIDEYTARRAFATSSARSGASVARSPGQIAEGEVKRKVTISAKRARELLGKRGSSPSSGGAPSSPAWQPGWPGRRSAARSCSSRRRRCRGRQAHNHGPDRGRDARVRAGPPSRGCAGTWTASRPRCPRTGFATHDIHIHVPAGAVPKDGPSAGVAMGGCPSARS
jgi:ATP-dependent Lon protease